MSGILGKKIGMTRIFQDDGRVIPITVIQCEPNEITQVKTVEKDGYPAIVLGFQARKKPTKTKKFAFVREFRVDKAEDYKIGDTITVESLKDVKEVTISGISKGKGFAGCIKRHHFSSGPGGHGSHFKREPGSIGARSKPGRIHKGKRMAGHMGNEKITIAAVPLMEIDKEQNALLVKGQVPGPKGGFITIKF